MKLSEESQKYSESIYRIAFHKVAVDSEKERRQIRSTANFSNPRIPQMSDHLVSLVKRLVDARLDSYIQAYKKEDLLIDEEDKDEIIEILRSLIKTQSRMISTRSIFPEFWLPGTDQLIPNIESYLTSRLEVLLGEAAYSLDLARNEMVMERKYRKPEPPAAHFNINVHGPNYGNIQQGGENNNQTINPKGDE